MGSWFSVWLRGLVPTFLLVLLSPTFALAAQETELGIEQSQERIGVTDTEVTIGSCICLKGPVQDRAQRLLSGAKAYFAAVNEQGGVHGRKILLKAFDDAYDGERAVDCFNNNLKNKVFAGAFFVGSVPIQRYVRLADANKMPMLGYSSGYAGLYEFHPTQFTLRPSFADEIQGIVDELWRRNIHKIALVYQDDSFGMSSRDAALKAMAKHGASFCVEGSYPRLATDTSATYGLIKSAKPEAVLLIGGAGSLVSTLKRKAQDKFNAIFVVMSVAEDYIMSMGKDVDQADGCVISHVLPALGSKQPGVLLYQKYRHAFAPGEPLSMSGLEGCTDAAVITEALRRAGKDLTRTKFVRALESLHNYDAGLGGNFSVSISNSNHNAVSPKAVHLSVLHKGKFEAITDADWTALLNAERQ
jgi:branched-chain amino acid transport system substrate-binding protein